MKKQITTLLAVTVLTTGLVAQAAAPVKPTLPAAWTKERLSTATYVILEPQMQGNPNLLNPTQREGILRAMKNDSGAAIKRRYPQAVIAAAGGAATAIQVRPVLVTPGALVPWAKLTARLEFTLPEGQNVVLVDQFGLLVLWQHQHDAANYLYDQLAQRLP